VGVISELLIEVELFTVVVVVSVVLASRLTSSPPAQAICGNKEHSVKVNKKMGVKNKRRILYFL
jgi:hypothetical protein